MKVWWLLTPLLSALIGWLIVKTLVVILFYPLKPKKVMGFTLQGVLPQQRKELSGRLSKLVSNELFSFKEIEQRILSHGNFQKILPEVEVHIDHFLSVKLKEKMPMVGMFVGERTLSQLKEIFMEELETLFPVIMRSYLTELEKDFNVEQMINEKLASIPDNKMSAYLSRAGGRQLKFLPLAGALLGFITGAIQLIVIYFFYR